MVTKTKYNIEAIFDFIQYSKEDVLSNVFCRDEDVLISMPLFFLKNLGYYIEETFGVPFNKEGKNYCCGLEIIPNSKNEIVVFYSKFRNKEEEVMRIFEL